MTSFCKDRCWSFNAESSGSCVGNSVVGVGGHGEQDACGPLHGPGDGAIAQERDNERIVGPNVVGYAVLRVMMRWQMPLAALPPE